jgi:hypothetical protein
LIFTTSRYLLPAVLNTTRPARSTLALRRLSFTVAGPDQSAAFAWTGTRRLFAAHGFKVVGNRDGGKQRVRLAVG